MIKPALIITVFLLFGLSVHAQNSSGEKKKLSPNELREKMKQDKAKNEIFGDTDEDFKVNTIPDKWKNESAVVLCQKTSFSFDKVAGAFYVDEMMRKKVKLLDKAAVDAFSQFYFTETSATGFVGFQIIKPDGKVVDVDMSGAVEDNSQVPDFYQTYYYENIQYKKLAVPDLQIGDIVDYYYMSERDIKDMQYKEYSFTPFMFTLSTTYPVLTQKFSFTVDRDFYINFHSYNGAPLIKDGPPVLDEKGKVRPKMKNFILEDRNRERISKDIWNYRFVTAPTVKFQVLYVTPGYASETDTRMSKTSYFIGEIGQVKTSVGMDVIQWNTSRDLKTSISIYADEITAYLNKYHAKETDPEKILRIAYYFFRYRFNEDYQRYYITGGVYMDYNVSYTDRVAAPGELYFCQVMLQLCEKEKIKAEIFVAVPRKFGPFENILLKEELKIGVLATVKGKELFIYPFDGLSTFDLKDDETDGVNGYAFNPEVVPRKELKSRKIRIPASGHAANSITYTVDASLDENMENMKINRKNVITGYLKSDYQLLALYATPWVDNDKKRFDPKYKELSEKPAKGNKAKIEEEKRKDAELEKERKDKQAEKFKELLADEFDVLSFDAFSLEQDGRFDETPDLVYTETFTVKNMINKAGKNFILDVGKLIGDQLKLEEAERKRDNDIFINFAKTFSCRISVTIPAGYTVDGINELNSSLDNESASFISSAKVEGNKLIITTTKCYKKNFEKKENWQNILTVLDAAYKFSQKKVILKKA